MGEVIPQHNAMPRGSGAEHSTEEIAAIQMKYKANKLFDFVGELSSEGEYVFESLLFYFFSASTSSAWGNL